MNAGASSSLPRPRRRLSSCLPTTKPMGTCRPSMPRLPGDAGSLYYMPFFQDEGPIAARRGMPRSNLMSLHTRQLPSCHPMKREINRMQMPLLASHSEPQTDACLGTQSQRWTLASGSDSLTEMSITSDPMIVLQECESGRWGCTRLRAASALGEFCSHRLSYGKTARNCVHALRPTSAFKVVSAG
jgi:hypothetical protein